MQYDHVPERGRKLFNLSAIPPAADAVMLRRELGKCDVVCANCHCVRTSNRAREKSAHSVDALDKLYRLVKKHPYLADFLVEDRRRQRDGEE
jgi:hypothetical protein